MSPNKSSSEGFPAVLAAALFAGSLNAQPLPSEPVDQQYREPVQINRYALLIGVQGYPEAAAGGLGRVDNAIADVNAVAEALSRLGFRPPRVIPDPDNKETILQAIDELLSLTGGPDQPATVAFYFAGHGFQHEGRNYLATRMAKRPKRNPISGEIDVTGLLEFSIDIPTIIDRLGSRRPAGVTILLIDACRSDLFAGELAQPQNPHRPGFSQVVDSQNVVLSLSTQYDSLARSQGQNLRNNSPYAGALEQLLPMPSVQFNPDLLADIKSYVDQDTGHAQIPESLNAERAGHFYFDAHESEWAAEDAYWTKALTMKRAECIGHFVASYPDGRLARQALKYLADHGATGTDGGPPCIF